MENNQNLSSKNSPIVNDVKKMKYDDGEPSSGENSTACKGHDFVNFCKENGVKDDDFQRYSSIVKGLNFFQS